MDTKGLAEEVKIAFYTFQEIRKDIEKSGLSIPGELADGYRDFVSDTNPKIGNILLEFNPDHYHYYRDQQSHSHKRWYDAEGIKVHVNRNFGILKAKFEAIESQDKPQLISQASFGFVNNNKLKEIAERDFKELQLAWISRSWKSVIILSGGLLEALLLDTLLQDQKSALACPKVPKKKPNLMEWNLSELITVANDLKKIKVGVDKLSYSLREYRNLVHPGKELTSGFEVKEEEATIALNVVKMVLREFGVT